MKILHTKFILIQNFYIIYHNFGLVIRTCHKPEASVVGKYISAHARHAHLPPKIAARLCLFARGHARATIFINGHAQIGPCHYFVPVAHHYYYYNMYSRKNLPMSNSHVFRKC